MYLIIITGVIGIAIAIYFEYDSDFLGYILESILGGVIGGLIGVSIAIILPMDTYQKHSSVMLESLQDNNNVSGNFFLGCGQIEGKMKFVFYYKTKEFYRMAQIDYDLVDIKYSDNKPKVNISTTYPTESFINNFAIDLDCYDKTFIIEVPKGTIKNNYSLDAQ